MFLFSLLGNKSNCPVNSKGIKKECNGKMLWRGHYPKAETLGKTEEREKTDEIDRED